MKKLIHYSFNDAYYIFLYLISENNVVKTNTMRHYRKQLMEKFGIKSEETIVLHLKKFKKAGLVIPGPHTGEITLTEEVSLSKETASKLFVPHYYQVYLALEEVDKSSDKTFCGASIARACGYKEATVQQGAICKQINEILDSLKAIGVIDYTEAPNKIKTLTYLAH